MRHLLKAAVTALVLVGVSARPALAISVDDLVNLKARGISDAILVALIEADGSIFHLSATDVLSLTRRGLSEDVILAMIATGKPKAEPSAPIVVPPAKAQPPMVIEDQPASPESAASRVTDTRTPVVHVHQTVTQTVEQPAHDRYVTQYVPIAVPVVVSRPEPRKAPEPVYWGFGGQRRPDTWNDPKVPAKPDPTPAPDKKGGSR